MSDWLMGALAAQDRYDPEEGARQAELRNAEQPYRGMPRLDPGIRRTPGDVAMRPAAETVGQVVGDLVIPQDPLDYAAMFALGPAGKLASKGVRAGALAMGGVLGLSSEAEAGKLDLIKKGIKAYHSSPHDFEKFDASKIGTGEGAQVYGHGLYFAENPKVSGQGGEYWNQFLRRFPESEVETANLMRYLGFDREKTAAMVQNQVDQLKKRSLVGTGGAVDKSIANAEAQIEMLRSGQPVGPRTYEVNIRADPREMLDWDRPLSQQTATQQRVAPLLEDYKLAPSNYLGEALHKEIKDFHMGHGMSKTAAAEAAAIDLRSMGIPGIKYLDQGSRIIGGIPRLEEKIAETKSILEMMRSTPPGPNRAERMNLHESNLAAWQKQLDDARNTKPTSNYVVFDPSIVDILKKYGIAGAAAPMGALAATDEYR